jgi:hypothetical protein
MQSLDAMKLPHSYGGLFKFRARWQIALWNLWGTMTLFKISPIEVPIQGQVPSCANLRVVLLAQRGRMAGLAEINVAGFHHVLSDWPVLHAAPQILAPCRAKKGPRSID